LAVARELFEQTLGLLAFERIGERMFDQFPGDAVPVGQRQIAEFVFPGFIGACQLLELVDGQLVRFAAAAGGRDRSAKFAQPLQLPVRMVLATARKGQPALGRTVGGLPRALNLRGQFSAGCKHQQATQPNKNQTPHIFFRCCNRSSPSRWSRPLIVPLS
jgi:hypothetical protein